MRKCDDKVYKFCMISVINVNNLFYYNIGRIPKYLTP